MAPYLGYLLLCWLHLVADRNIIVSGRLCVSQSRPPYVVLGGLLRRGRAQRDGAELHFPVIAEILWCHWGAVSRQPAAEGRSRRISQGWLFTAMELGRNHANRLDLCASTLLIWAPLGIHFNVFLVSALSVWTLFLFFVFHHILGRGVFITAL